MTVPTAASLIPADVRARLKSLQLVARRAAGARGFGLHRSASRGAGLEFAQYRSYGPGDALRQVDWKLYARSDRFFVREAERDSPLDLWLLVDASASMAQGDAARPGWSRLDAARGIAACAIELALRQGDRFGVLAVGGAGVHAVPLGAGRATASAACCRSPRCRRRARGPATTCCAARGTTSARSRCCCACPMRSTTRCRRCWKAWRPRAAKC